MKLKDNPSNDDVIKKIIEESKPSIVDEVVDENKISVIHVVGPNTLDITDKGTFPSKYHRFVHELSFAYNSVIDIFEKATTGKTLRLLPISGGIFRFMVKDYAELKSELSFKRNLNSSKMDGKMKKFYNKYPQTNEDILFKICNGYIDAYNNQTILIKDILPLEETDITIPSIDVLNTILLGLYTAECFIMSIFDLEDKRIEMCLFEGPNSTPELNELLLRVIFTHFMKYGFIKSEDLDRYNKVQFSSIEFTNEFETTEGTKVVFNNESFIKPIEDKNHPTTYIYCDPAGATYIKGGVTGAGGASDALYKKIKDPLKGVNDKILKKYPTLKDEADYVGCAVYKEYELKGNPTPSIVEDIYVMSYNLWYKSVKKQGHNNLRNECTDGSKNKCIDNIVKIIKGDDGAWDGSHTHPKTFDFIATQESTSNYGAIHIAIDTNKYDVVSTNGSQPIVTFYDKTKYSMIFHMGFGTKGRPKHIILFENKKTNALYLFINLHNDHKKTGVNLQKEIRDAIDGINDAAFTNKRNSIENIIVAGDFNDEGRKYFNGLSVLGKEVRYNNTPPNTCCYDPTTGTGQISKIGDYVLSTMNITDMYVPLSTKWRNPSEYPASDHLPVVAVIK